MLQYITSASPPSIVLGLIVLGLSFMVQSPLHVLLLVLGVSLIVLLVYFAIWYVLNRATSTAYEQADTASAASHPVERRPNHSDSAFDAQTAKRIRAFSGLLELAEMASRSLSLNALLQQSLERVLLLTGGQSGVVYLLDEPLFNPLRESFTAKTTAGSAISSDVDITLTDNTLTDNGTRALTLLAHAGLNARALNEIELMREDLLHHVVDLGELLVIRDALLPAAADSTPGSTEQNLTPSGFRERVAQTLVGLPLVTKGNVCGALLLTLNKREAFDECDEKLFTSIGHQIGIAIANTRLFETEQMRAKQFQALNEIGRTALSTVDVDELLDQTARLVQRTLGFEQVIVGLRDGDDVIIAAGAGPLWHVYPPPPRVKLGEGIMGHVASTGEHYCAFDVQHDALYVPLLPAGQIRSELAVPLAIKGEVTGVISVQSKRTGIFDQSTISIIEGLANQTAVAVENARLYQQAQQLAALEERERLARELHDSVTQSLYSLVLMSEGWRRRAAVGQLCNVTEVLTELSEISRQTLKEMRLLVYELRPPALEQDGLIGALRHRMSFVEKRSGVSSQLITDELLVLPPHVEEGLYRIAQEALNNTLKHASATEIRVRLDCSADQVRLDIEDNGVGFDYSRAVYLGGGMGLTNMRERAERLGGYVTVDSDSGTGTHICVYVPLESDMPACA